MALFPAELANQGRFEGPLTASLLLTRSRERAGPPCSRQEAARAGPEIGPDVNACFASRGGLRRM